MSTLIFTLALFSIPAQGQNRLSTVGQLLKDSPGVGRTYSSTEALRGERFASTANAAAAFEQPHFLFKAVFAMENWILAGTAVHSCGVEWEYIDPYGNRSDEFVYVSNFTSILPDASRRALINDSGQTEIYRILNGDPAIEFVDADVMRIRRDALSHDPILFNLDFLVPLDHLGTRRTPEGETLSFEFHSVRCLTGAIGGPDDEDFNTPYAFDLGRTIVRRPSSALGGDIAAVFHGDEVGAYISEDQTRQRIEYMVNTLAARDPDRVYEAPAFKTVVTDIEFNMFPVLNYIERVLRGAAQEAAIEARVLREEQRRQAFEEQIAAGEQPDPNVVPAEDRAFDSGANGVETIDAMMRGLRETVLAEVETRVLDSTASNVRSRIRQGGDPITEERIAVAERRAGALDSALTDYLEESARSGPAAVRDLADLQNAVPKDLGAQFMYLATLEQSYETQQAERCIENCNSGFVLIARGPNDSGRSPPRRAEVFETYEYLSVSSKILARLTDAFWLDCRFSRNGQELSGLLDPETGEFELSFNSESTRTLQIDCPGFEPATIDFWAEGWLPVDPAACARFEAEGVCSSILSFAS